MTNPTWGIGSVVDLNAAGFRLLRRSTIWRPDIATRQNVLELPGHHGQLQPWRPPVFETPTVTLLVGANGSDMPTLEEARQRLEALLTAPDVVLTRTSGDQVTTAPARLVTVTEGTWMADGWWRLQVILQVPGVFFYGAKVDFTIPLASGTVEVSTLAGSTAPIGDVVAQIIGPASSVVLRDPLTRTGLMWTGGLEAGESLYLDVARLEAWTGAWSGGPTRSHELDYPPEGPLQLWPQIRPDLSRRVQVDVTATGTAGGSQLVLRAAPTFF